MDYKLFSPPSPNSSPLAPPPLGQGGRTNPAQSRLPGPFTQGRPRTGAPHLPLNRLKEPVKAPQPSPPVGKYPKRLPGGDTGCSYSYRPYPQRDPVDRDRQVDRAKADRNARPRPIDRPSDRPMQTSNTVNYRNYGAGEPQYNNFESQDYQDTDFRAPLEDHQPYDRKDEFGTMFDPNCDKHQRFEQGFEKPSDLMQTTPRPYSGDWENYQQQDSYQYNIEENNQGANWQNYDNYDSYGNENYEEERPKRTTNIRNDFGQPYNPPGNHLANYNYNNNYDNYYENDNYNANNGNYGQNNGGQYGTNYGQANQDYNNENYNSYNRQNGRNRQWNNFGGTKKHPNLKGDFLNGSAPFENPPRAQGTNFAGTYNYSNKPQQIGHFGAKQTGKTHFKYQIHHVTSAHVPQKNGASILVSAKYEPYMMNHPAKNMMEDLSQFSKSERSIQYGGSNYRKKNNREELNSRAVTSLRTIPIDKKASIRARSFDELIKLPERKAKPSRTDYKSELAIPSFKQKNYLKSKVSGQVIPRYIKKEALDPYQQLSTIEYALQNSVSKPSGTVLIKPVMAPSRQNPQKTVSPVNPKNVPYNKEEVIAKFLKLRNQGWIDETQGHLFFKYDEELQQEIQYIRFDLLETPQKLNNDHIISVKQDSSPQDSTPKEFDRTYQHGRIKIRFSEAGFNKLNGLTNQTTNPSTYLTNQNHNQAQGPGPVTITGPPFPTISPPYLNSLPSNPQPNANNLPNLLPPCEPSLLQQARHKTLTGKLQRNIKKMNDEEKVAVFKALKPALSELIMDQYGKYVIVLLMKTGIVSIIDTLIAYFNKLFDNIVTHSHGCLFCQSLIEFKYKDVRLKRFMKQIDDNIYRLINDEYGVQVVLTYVTQVPQAELSDMVKFFKKEYKLCVGRPIVCKILAKVFTKASDVERLELELLLKHLIFQLFEASSGKELVESFITKADPKNLQPFLQRVLEQLPDFLGSEEHEYFFTRMAELKRLSFVDQVLSSIFVAEKAPASQIVNLLNHPTASQTFLSFFTLASIEVKQGMRQSVSKLKQEEPSKLGPVGQKVLSLCDIYFSSEDTPPQAVSQPVLANHLVKHSPITALSKPN